MIRTPDIEPELLESRLTEAINSEHDDRRASKGSRSHQSVIPRVAT